jgi:hypothetical protein
MTINQQLVKNASQAYVMAKYLANFCERVGKVNYLTSPVRLEHATGTGFFGVGNTGSTDCIKERFRGVTDNLGQRWSCWQRIEFVSESCVGITDADFKNTHRVEHTREVIDLFKTFEEEFIIKNREFTANDLAIWIIEHQVVCLIEQREQKSQSHYDDARPFTKYASSIFYKGTDISQYTLDQLIELNKQRFEDVISALKTYDFSKLNAKHHKDLIIDKKKHTLPPLDLAVEFHNDQFELLDRHYHHKLNKRTNPADKKWYSTEDTAKFNNWKKAKLNEELQVQ